MHFFARRHSKLEIHIDSRRKLDGTTPRRKSKKLSFLTTSRINCEDDYLYESQISVLVNADDNETYVAYCCVDQYYDENVPSEDSRAPDEGEINYDTDADTSDENVSLDPLTREKQATDRPINDAREYFLTVVDEQVQYVCNEWKNTVYLVQRQFECHVSHDCPVSIRWNFQC